MIILITYKAFNNKFNYLYKILIKAFYLINLIMNPFPNVNVIILCIKNIEKYIHMYGCRDRSHMHGMTVTLIDI